jgi:MFS family permease
MNDRQLIYAAAFLRAVATGMLGVLLGLYLARRGFDAAAIGLVVTAGLLGASLAALAATFLGDRLGRRRLLIVLSALASLGGLAAVFASELGALLLAAFLGMMNGMGRDRGAALILEQAILPATADDAGRTGVFARYNMYMDIGHALGALAAGLPALAERFDLSSLAALQLALGLYGLLMLASTQLLARLSPASESGAQAATALPELSPQSRRVLTRISLLFAIDSLAGGFLGSALIAYFFFERFGVSAALIGLLFFGARIMNALSHLGAAWLAARIGLVNTMVFTHVPSSLLLMTVPFAPDFATAALLFLLREGLVEMDVPTRQSYVMAMVKPEERTFASGVTHLVRLGGWASGPWIAGLLMQGLSLGAPLVAGALMKIGYDVALYRSFRRIKPPEEHMR